MWLKIRVRRVAAVAFRQRIDFRQCVRRLPHVEFAGHHIGDDASAVFLEKVDLPLSMGDVVIDRGCGLIDEAYDVRLLGVCRELISENFAALEVAKSLQSISPYLASPQIGASL